MQLASIQTQEENDRLEKYVKDYGKMHDSSWFGQACNNSLHNFLSTLARRSRHRTLLDLRYRSGRGGQLLLGVERSTAFLHQLERRWTEQLPLRKRRGGALSRAVEPGRQGSEMERHTLQLRDVLHLRGLSARVPDCDCVYPIAHTPSSYCTFELLWLGSDHSSCRFFFSHAVMLCIVFKRSVSFQISGRNGRKTTGWGWGTEGGRWSWPFIDVHRPVGTSRPSPLKVAQLFYSIV